MAEFYYILLVTLTLLGVFSLSMGNYRTASILVILWSFISFTMNGVVEGISASGSLVGIFFVAIISMIMALMFLVFYQTEYKKILLKLSVASSVLSVTNLLCIMTYIKPIREMWWYHSPTFDLFYWNYGELQIVLTIYMITLFGKSGIMGLTNGFNATRKYINSLRNLYGGMVDNSNSYCEEVAQKNEIYKKGIIS